MKWTIDQLIQEQKRLLTPGIIGFFESFEVTEIVGFHKDGTATNFFSLIVAEHGLPPEGPVSPACLTQNRIELKGSEYKFGVFRFRVSIQSLIATLEIFAKTGQWKAGPKPLKVGKLEAVIPQFVHADSNDPHPWNSVLKNNFYEGSHVLELFDTTKEAARFLLSDSRLLTELSQRVRSVVLMDIDGLSDRLGNIVIQLPVTVISTGVRGSPIGDQNIRVAWHERATPRPLRVSCEIYDDSTVDAFDSKTVATPPGKPEDSTFKLRSPGGGARTHIWDDENKVLLSVSPVQTFLLSVGISMRVSSIDDPGEPKREFSVPVKNEAPRQEEVELKQVDKPYFVGSTPDRPREPWRTERIFKLSSRQLQERKEFVQYGQFTERDQKNALADIHWLLERHGALGAWLWDPFLSAEDVLRTLFFSPHRNSDLRALSNGNTFESPADADVDNGDGQSSALLHKKISLLRKSISRKNLAQHKAHDCCARVGARKEYRFMQQRRQSSVPAPAVDASIAWRNKQREVLDTHCGNRMGLKLEFRLRRKGAGWKFHDRFLIFPQADGHALAWSLGTSVNSLGTSHHILQKVSNGELVQNAFLSLWDQLDLEDYKVWKAGK